MKSSTLGFAALMLCAVFCVAACGNTNARQEQDRLKAQVLDLQKQLGEMGNRVDEATKAKDDLMKENVALREENNRLKDRHKGSKKTKSRRRKRIHTVANGV